MKASIKMFSAAGDTTVLEYDPAVESEREAAQVRLDTIHNHTGAAFIDQAGNRVDKITGQEQEINVVVPIHGG